MDERPFCVGALSAPRADRVAFEKDFDNAPRPRHVYPQFFLWTRTRESAASRAETNGFPFLGHGHDSGQENSLNDVRPGGQEVADENFTGDRKAPMRSPLAAAEKRLIQAWTPRFPGWLEGYHLTMCTTVWSAGLVLAGAMAPRNPHWLWLSSLMLVLQWFTDSFDGALGRRRDTGIPKWGFYMDHFLDYVFMACVFTHYAFLVNHDTRILLFVLALAYGGFEANSWLEFGATGQFRITYLGAGPTEVRVLFILVNAAIVCCGTAWLEAAVPWVLGVGVLMLVVVVSRTARRVWAIDMADKAARQESPDSRDEPGGVA